MDFNYQTRAEDDDHDHSHQHQHLHHQHKHHHHHHSHSPLRYQNHIPITRDPEPMIIEKTVPVPIPVQTRGNSIRKPVRYDEIPYLDTPDYPERTRRYRRTPTPPPLTDRTKPVYIPYPVPYPVMSSAPPAINYPQMSFPPVGYPALNYSQPSYPQMSYPQMTYPEVNYQPYTYPETVMVTPQIPYGTPQIHYNTPQISYPQVVYSQPQVIEQKPLNPVYNVVVAQRNVKPQIIETNYEIVRRKNPGGKYLTYVD